MDQNQNKIPQPIENESDFLIESHDSSPEDQLFDQIVGALQDIVMEPQFSKMETAFIKDNCMVFEPNEENKNEYMGIFAQYQDKVEKHILTELIVKIPNFSMQSFQNLLSTRTDQIDEDLLQMLHSFTDFCAFKSLMLEHKQFYSREETLKELSIKGTVLNGGFQ